MKVTTLRSPQPLIISERSVIVLPDLGWVPPLDVRLILWLLRLFGCQSTGQRLGRYVSRRVGHRGGA
jgi:hypothetical protein